MAQVRFDPDPAPTFHYHTRIIIPGVTHEWGDFYESRPYYSEQEVMAAATAMMDLFTMFGWRFQCRISRHTTEFLYNYHTSLMI